MNELFVQGVVEIFFTKLTAWTIIFFSTTVTSVKLDLLDGDWGPAPSSPFCHLRKDVCPQILCKADSKNL